MQLLPDFWITLVLVSLTYIGIAVGRWPSLRANRTTIALMGAGLLVFTRQIDFKDIGGFLDLDTLILLFSMMVINANLRLAGFFGLAGNALLRLTRNPRKFLALEILVTGLLSALFLNDTICLMFTPLVLDLTLTIGRNPIPYLLALATSANIGSTATLTGNPQNMIIGVASGISYIDFSAALAPIALLSMAVIWFILIKLYPQEFGRRNLFKIQPTTRAPYYPALLIKCIVMIIALLIAFLVGAPIAEASFLAACAMLFTRRVKPEKIFAEFDWGLLVFFGALFVVTGSLESNGITEQIGQFSTMIQNIDALNLSALSLVLSNLVSNVPAVLLLRSLVITLPDANAGWLTLAASSTLAGNLTLLGSVANLIVAEIAARRNIHLGFWQYTKAGLLITLISLVISTLWLHFFIW